MIPAMSKQRKQVDFLGIVLLLMLATGAFGQMDAAALRSYFAPLIDAKAHEAAMAGHIENLGADSYKLRRSAQKALGQAPFLPRGLLHKAQGSADPEVRLRVGELLAADADRKQQVGAALGAVAEQKVSGLAAPLLALAPHLEPDQSRVWQQAFEASSTDKDQAALLKALPPAAGHPGFARQSMVRILGGREGVSDDTLLPLLQDPAPPVVLEAAQALLNRERREALPRLGGLLNAEAFGMRWRASALLRGATGQNFGFAPDADLAVRAKAAKQWAAWLSENGATAKLTLPVAAPSEILLFNGVDLSNWVAVNGDGIDAKKTDWSVKEGVIVCAGNDNGHLRTREKFKNYKLDLTWRWPVRGGVARGGDSGVFLHLSGADRTFGRSCIEAQLLAGKAGDFWVIGGFECDVGGRRVGGFAPKKEDSSENKEGEWNKMAVKVKDGTLQVWVNGVLQNEATKCPLDPAHIGLQSEGDSVEFGRVLLTPLD